jgi:outer membrane immunogenic protein
LLVNASHDRNGFVVGGGVETALAGPWSAKLEYLYMNLGSVTDSFSTGFAGATFSTTTDIRDHIVRVGLNYRFGGPVIANY